MRPGVVKIAVYTDGIFNPIFVPYLPYLKVSGVRCQEVRCQVSTFQVSGLMEDR